MNVKNTSKEDHKEELDADSASVDDFIKELEEKEKDLDISSDLVIEVGESEVEHENIHDSFVANLSNSSPDLKDVMAGNHSPALRETRVQSEVSDEMLETISKLNDETNGLKESLARRQRDFDNYRKRTERERQDTFRNVAGNVAAQMLPVMDNLNRALDAFSEVDEKEEERDMKTFHEGVILVNQQLNEVLANMGVQQIAAIDEPFDPHRHEAVAREETDDVPPDTVIEEILRGYRIDDKIIRPSMVKVSASNLPQDADNSQNSNLSQDKSPDDE